MTGSFADAEDLAQETLARAVASSDSFRGHASVRTWLYRIATNACRDHLRQRGRRRTLPFSAMDAVNRGGPAGGDHGPFIEPIPDTLLDETPEDVASTRETIELAFIAAIQHLTPVQRAVFVVRDVLGWSAADAAVICDRDVGAVKSALQRARATLRTHLDADVADWPSRATTGDERIAVRRYVEAHVAGDADALARVLRDDLRVAYPSIPMWVDGAAAFITGSRKHAPPGEVRFEDFRANRQPGVAIYHRPPQESSWSLVAVELLVVLKGQVVEVVDVDLGDRAAAYGLARTIT